MESLAVVVAGTCTLLWIGSKERRVGSELARMKAAMDAEE